MMRRWSRVIQIDQNRLLSSIPGTRRISTRQAPEFVSQLSSSRRTAVRSRRKRAAEDLTLRQRAKAKSILAT